MRHSSALTSLIEEVLTTANVHPSALSAVAVSNGPGSYTGLRVGASTAKAVCFGLDIPLIAISTLESLARSIDDDYIMSTIDARRMEVYSAIYDHNYAVIEDITNVIWTEEVASKLSEKYTSLTICGTGIEKARALFESTSIKIAPSTCDATRLIDKSLLKYHTKDFEDIAYHVPFYFKSPNITTPKKLFIK